MNKGWKELEHPILMDTVLIGPAYLAFEHRATGMLVVKMASSGPWQLRGPLPEGKYIQHAFSCVGDAQGVEGVLFRAGQLIRSVAARRL